MWSLSAEASYGYFYQAIVEQRAGNTAAARQAAEESLALGFPEAIVARDPDLNEPEPCTLLERRPAPPDVCRVE